MRYAPAGVQADRAAWASLPAVPPLCGLGSHSTALSPATPMMNPAESTVAEVDAAAVLRPETSSGASSDTPPLPQKVVITPQRRCAVPAMWFCG